MYGVIFSATPRPPAQQEGVAASWCPLCENCFCPVLDLRDDVAAVELNQTILSVLNFVEKHKHTTGQHYRVPSTSGVWREETR